MTSPPDFIGEWCKMYGLDEDTASYLRQHGYTTGDALVTLRVDDIRRFRDLDDIKKSLLPGALLSYKQSRSTVDKQLEMKGINTKQKGQPDDRGKDLREVWRRHVSTMAKTSKVFMTMMPPDKREAFLALRKKLENSKPQLSPEQMNQMVDDTLASILSENQGQSEPDDPDAPEVDLAESQRKTEQVLAKLEKELFTEEELELVAKVREIQKKYSDMESPEYEQEIAELVASM